MLYVCGIIIYVANIVKGMRVIASGKYDVELVQGEVAVGGGLSDTLGRDDSLRVMAASNTILALVLVGVLVLQAGQWYAERKDIQEDKQARDEKAANSAAKSGEGNKHRSPAGAKKKN